MTHTKNAQRRTIAKIGLGVGVAVAAAAVIQTARRNRRGSPDSAPDYTLRHSGETGETAGRTVTIRKPRAELFGFWRDFSNLPQFMKNLERVEPGAAEGLSIWFIHGPMGKVFKIETRIDQEIANELIAWKSTPGSEVETEGCVTFKDAPGERGTRVSLINTYHQRGGALGTAIAKLMGVAPSIQARHDLKRFKMLMEAGEIATSARCNDETTTPDNQSEENA